MKKWRFLITLLIALFIILSQTQAATPPAQLATDKPGGTGRYTYTGDHIKYKDGSRANSVWWFEPRTAGGEKPGAACPFVVFMHGQAFIGLAPTLYAGIIRHFTKQGIVVIYPEYQAITTLPSQYIVKAGNNTKRAMDIIAADPSTYVQLDTDHMGLSGHSQGGCNAAMLGANYATYGLPEPDWLAPLFPAGFRYDSADMANYDSDTAFCGISIAGDLLASDRQLKKMLPALTNVANTEKVNIHINTESYGGDSTTGGHMSVLGTSPDAPAYYGYLRVMDGLIDYKFYGLTYRKSFCLVVDPNTYDHATDAADPNGLAHAGLWSDAHPHTPKDVVYYDDSTQYGGITEEPGMSYEGFFVYDPAELADGVGATETVSSLVGPTIGDFVLIGPPYDLQGINMSASVSADGSIALRLQNETTGTIDLASGTWKWKVIKQE